MLSRGSRRSKIFHFFQNVGLTWAPQGLGFCRLRLAEQGFVVVLPSYRRFKPSTTAHPLKRVISNDLYTF